MRDSTGWVFFFNFQTVVVNSGRSDMRDYVLRFCSDERQSFSILFMIFCLTSFSLTFFVVFHLINQIRKYAKHFKLQEVLLLFHVVNVVVLLFCLASETYYLLGAYVA